MTEQPCFACGRETAPGSTLFAGRRQGLNRASGDAVVVCAACMTESRANDDRGNSALSTLALADIFLSPPA